MPWIILGALWAPDAMRIARRFITASRRPAAGGVFLVLAAIMLGGKRG